MPSSPELFNDLTSPLSLLQTRRSGKPRKMVAPGPSREELQTILSVATRVPDHGKLAPWRFVIISPEQRDAFSQLLTDAYRAEKQDAGRLEIEAMDQFARQAPWIIVVLSTPVAESKIPLWEQQLSTGAACMQLLNATHALGYVGSWLTGWPTYSPTVRDVFGTARDSIAGFIFLGTAGDSLEERPRPDASVVIRDWQV